MKKYLSLLLILGLVFVMSGCDSFGTLEDKGGFGQLLINKVTLPDKTLVDDATIKIGDVEGVAGEVINIAAGTYDVSVTAEIEGLKYGATLPGIVIETGKTNIIEEAVIDVLSNAWKFIFDPSEYGVTVENEVHLVGDLPNSTWDPANEFYPLVKQPDGTWVGIYDVPEGTEFKFIYDSTSWNGHDIGDNGNNLIVGQYSDIVEPVLAWKFIFDPSEYGVTVENEVHLVGDLPNSTWDPANELYPLVKQPDGIWVGIYDVPEGTEFKFIYDSTSWNGHDIGDNGNNLIVGQYPDIVTQNF